MFTQILFGIFMVNCWQQIAAYPPAESYAQVNLLGGKLLGGDLGLTKVVQLAKLEPDLKVDYIAYPQYGFKYGVADAKTGDRKEQSEERDGDVVKGQYSLAEPDGTIRTVKYVADKHSGFNAQVIRSGHALHPQTVQLQKVFAVQAPLKSLGLDSLGSYGLSDGLKSLGLGYGKLY